jgi:hypothetical protein
MWQSHPSETEAPFVTSFFSMAGVFTGHVLQKQTLGDCHENPFDVLSK